MFLICQLIPTLPTSPPPSHPPERYEIRRSLGLASDWLVGLLEAALHTNTNTVMLTPTVGLVPLCRKGLCRAIAFNYIPHTEDWRCSRVYVRAPVYSTPPHQILQRKPEYMKQERGERRRKEKKNAPKSRRAYCFSTALTFSICSNTRCRAGPPMAALFSTLLSKSNTSVCMSSSKTSHNPL